VSKTALLGLTAFRWPRPGKAVSVSCFFRTRSMGRKSKRRHHHPPSKKPEPPKKAAPAPAPVVAAAVVPPATSEPATPSSSTPPPPPSPPDPHQTLRRLRRDECFGARFHLRRLLGKGAHSAVWLAHDAAEDRECALQILSSAYAADPKIRAALEQGIAQQRTLEHPNIARLFALIEDPERQLLAIAGELAPGRSLTALRQEQQPQRWFEPAQIAPWLAALCRALACAHTEAKATHGDLKPGHLLLDEHGQLKLIDFGIPALGSSVVVHAVPDETSGTPAYQSPAQLRGEPLSPADDLYALGVTLYELLTGKPPFLAASAGYQLHQILTQRPPTITERRQQLTGLNAPIAPEWEETIAALLSPEPADRPEALALVARLNLPAETPAAPSPAPAPATEAPAPAPAVPEEKLSALAPTLETLPATSPTAAPADSPTPNPSTNSPWLAAAGWTFGLLALGVLGWWFAQEKPRAAQAAPLPTSATAASATATAAPSVPTPRIINNLPALTNSLGIRLVPLPGTQVRIAIWPTRVRDFAAFADATQHRSGRWKNPGFEQTPDHPVVNVSWHDAVAFCQWLTRTEREQGRIAATESYRLPTDAEWSRGVGLPVEEGTTPEQRDIGVPDVFPWGKQWPPPHGAGNYSGQEAESDTTIRGYEDGFIWTSPVGSFPANAFGLYDMGGNVWQWCADAWNPTSDDKVARGASWYNGSVRLSLLSSCRVHASTDSSRDNFGFRIVLAPEKEAHD